MIAIYDVFARRPFDGNQAAVVQQGRRRVTGEELLTLAGELSVAETALLSRKGSDLAFRFANADRLLNTCGHAALAGVAHHVFSRVRGVNKSVREWTGRYRMGPSPLAEWRARPVSSSASSKGDFFGIDVAVAWPDRPRHVSSLPAAPVYRALGLIPRDHIYDLPLCIYDSGNLNALVPVRTVRDLKRAMPNWPMLKALFRKHGLTDLHIYCLLGPARPSRQVNVRCRNVFPYGLFEETATGTASVSLAASLIDQVPIVSTADEPIHFRFNQGIGKRRGIISVHWCPQRETIYPTIWLSGRVFCVIKGYLLANPSEKFRTRANPK